MAKETSSTIFKDLVNSPVGIISEFIVNNLAAEIGYKPLKDFIAEIQTGKTPPMSNPEYYSSHDMEWIKPSDIGFEKYITGSDYISNFALRDKKATIYKPNTVLIICIGGGIGRLGIVNKTCSSNQQITGILFKDSVLPEFAYYFFLSRYKIFEANSSKSTLPIINQKALGNLDFISPKLVLQKEVIRFIEHCKECLSRKTYPLITNWALDKEIIDFAITAFKAYYTQKELLKECQFQLIQLENLNQAILQEAVQGKLVPQNPADEPASELLKRIKAEKEKSGKKEKSLPPIKLEEIPFEIPESWVWCRLGEITNYGSSPKAEPSDLKNNTWVLDLEDIEKTTSNLRCKIRFDERNSLSTKSVFKVGDVLYSKLRPYLDKVIVADEEGVCTTEILPLKCFAELNPYFLKYTLKRSDFLLYVNSKTKGMKMPRLGTNEGQLALIPLAPCQEQPRIVAEIEKQLAKTKQLKEHIIANQHATEQLLKALLHEAFEVSEIKEAKTEEKESKVIEFKPTNVDYYKRTVLAAEIVWQLHKEPTLGHLKLQKLIYLCQKSAQMQLPTNFLRQAMGPYDPKLMRSIDKQLKEKHWFEYHEGELYKYQPLEKAGQHHADFEKYFSAEQASIQFILDTFKTVKSDFVEIVSTLYACLENLKAENVILSEGLLLQRFYEWSDEKAKFNENEVRKVYKRMLELGIVPQN